MASVLVDVQIDGSTVLTDQAFDTTDAPLGVRYLWIGSAFSGFPTANRKIRNVKVGTTGWGSTDLYAPPLTSSGDFNDGLFEDTAAISFAGGVMSIVSPGSGQDAYGEQDLGSSYTDIYVQLDYQRDESAGDETGYFVALVDSLVDSNFVDGFTVFEGDLFFPWGRISGAGAADGVWQTVALHYRFAEAAAPISVTPATITFTASGSQNVTVATDAAGWDGSDTDIGLSIDTALPFGVTASFAASPVTPGDSTTLTITVASDTDAGGAFTVTVRGTGSTSDTFTATLTITLGLPGTGRFDTVTGTLQIGSDMESTAYNAADWAVTVNADPAHASGTVQNVPGPRMIRHNGTYYVCHMEPDASHAPEVHYLDSGSWVSISPAAMLLAHYGSLANHKFMAEYDIASDGTDLWLTYRWWKIALPGPPIVYAGFVSLLKLSGGTWSFVDDRFIDQGESLRHTTHNVTADAGVAYVELLAGDVQVCFDSDGNSYGGIPTLAGFYPTDSKVVADGGTPFILATYATDPTDHDNGVALRSYALDGTLIEAKDEIDLIGPLADRPVDTRISDVGEVKFADGVYYVDMGGPVVTVSADGATFDHVFGDVVNDWARQLEYGSIAWDTTGAKPWLIDRFGEPTTDPLIIYSLQPPCASELWPYALRWEKLLDGQATGQPFYVPSTSFGLNAEILLGDSYIDGNYIYTALTRCQIDGANPGDTSDPDYNAHVQVWRTTICRNCGMCSGVTVSLHAWDRF